MPDISKRISFSNCHSPFTNPCCRNITHYSYFGAFRSDVSNVGANAAMLTQDGELTDIGSWYMGGAATNNVPEDSSAAPVGIVAAKGYFAFVVAVAVGLFWV